MLAAASIVLIYTASMSAPSSTCAVPFAWRPTIWCRGVIWDSHMPARGTPADRGMFPRAETPYRRCTGPSVARYWHQFLSIASLRMEDFETAIESAGKAVELQPGFVFNQVFLGEALCALTPGGSSPGGRVHPAL